MISIVTVAVMIGVIAPVIVWVAVRIIRGVVRICRSWVLYVVNRGSRLSRITADRLRIILRRRPRLLHRGLRRRRDLRRGFLRQHHSKDMVGHSLFPQI